MSNEQFRSLVWRTAEWFIGMRTHLHPDLGELCSRVGRKSAMLDLLAGKPLLEGVNWPPKLARVCGTEGRIFGERLLSAGLDRSAIRSAEVEFKFRLPDSFHPVQCRVRVETCEGIVIEHVADAGYPRPKRAD